MFESAKQHLERAYQHLADFDRMWGAYTYTNPYRATVNEEVKDGELRDVWLDVVASAPLPGGLDRKTTDSIHSLRLALDELTRELIVPGGGTQDREVGFPTGETREVFEAAANAIVAAREDTKQFFINLAAYPGGDGEDLFAIYLLDELDRRAVTYWAEIQVTFVLRSSGKRMWRTVCCDLADGLKGKIEYHVGWRVEDADDLKPSVQILFGEISVFPGQAVSMVLAILAQVVVNTIGGAERMVRARV